MSTGVKDTVTGRSVTARNPGDLRGMPVRPAMLYARARTDDLEASRSTLAARPAPEVPLTTTTVTSGCTKPAATAGTSANKAAVG